MIPFLPVWTLLARFAVPLIVVGSAAAGIWAYGHSQFKAGERATEARYTQQRIEADQEDRRIEQRRGSISQEITNGYVKIATRARASAAATRTELDGLRADLATDPREGANAATAGGADATAIYRELLGECATRYTEVAQSADEARDRLAALQSWVKGVCLDAEPSTPAP